ncbi:MAG TPA: LysR family transcriptional regulator [Streptosporangiaceae bacterium]|jgi:DNA-binding transcriptional LysR family regulator|nr:LysR family transcriptional regulator [Streptosporangiaceae bacterium]
MLEPDALRSFAVFAEHGNFTTAAAALNITQPSLHVKINKLAAALGITLYERRGRGLVLTAPGERLAAFALDTRRRCDDFLAVLNEGTSTVTIAAGRGTFRWVIPGPIRAISQQGRKVQVITASRDAAVSALGAGRADLAVVAYDPPPRRFQVAQVAVYPQVLVVSSGHPLAARDHLSLPDLAGLDLIVPPPGRAHRRALERALLDADVPWQPAAEADGWDLLVHFASLGIGATVVNGCVTPPAGLTAIPVTGLPAVRYWAAWRPERRANISDVLSRLVRHDQRPHRHQPVSVLCAASQPRLYRGSAG